MAVYKRGYEPYEGPLTPSWTRFLIPARYAWRRVFDSRFLIAFFAVCYAYPLVAAVIVYLPHNAAVLAAFPPRSFSPVGARFFLDFLGWQGTLALLLTAFVGPGLVSPDLANNALPLYFCRPFSRAEYVAGKMSVLAILLSAVTWAPGLLLFAWKAYLEGSAWLWANLRIAGAVFLGCWIWILVLCLLALAISAWVKWRIAAGALILGVFFVAAGFGEALNNVLHTHTGDLVNMARLIAAVWGGLFRIQTRAGAITEGQAWSVLLGGCGVCLWLLARKVRAYEVVRS